MTPGSGATDTGRVFRFIERDSTVASVRDAAGVTPVYLVGGSIRDLLLGREPSEIDFAVEGPVEEIAGRLDPNALLFPEFGTAQVELDGVTVDLAGTRREQYATPGALPTVSPADLAEDLGRRDFTVNAIAVPIAESGEAALIDPFDGLRDLEEGVLRILHPGSLRDDPTRAFRAARYCSRLSLEPDSATLGALRAADPSTISVDRLSRELELIASDEDPASALGFLDSWGLIEIDRDALDSAGRAFELARSGEWRSLVAESDLIEGLLSGPTLESARRLNGVPDDPWTRFEAARREGPTALLIAKAMGADWLDIWPAGWSGIELEITGDDLAGSGIPEGPAIGRGLEAALEDRIRNGPGGRDRELDVALREARAGGES